MHENINSERIGNLLIFLCSKIENLSLTKALKLVYIIDEESVKSSGVPVTWLEYKAWKYGPVATAIYDEIKLGNKTDSDQKLLLTDFVEIKTRINPDRNNQEERFLFRKKDFDDLVFSDFEIDLFNNMIKKFGSYSSAELIEYLHKEDTIWNKLYKEKELEKEFELQEGKSKYTVNLTALVSEDDIKSLSYKSAFGAQEFQNKLNNK